MDIPIHLDPLATNFERANPPRQFVQNGEEIETTVRAHPRNPATEIRVTRIIERAAFDYAMYCAERRARQESGK